MSKAHKPKPIEQQSRRMLLRHIRAFRAALAIALAETGAAQAEADYWRERCVGMIQLDAARKRA